MTDHQHTAETLHRAADLIEERGWIQGPAGMKPNGPHCLLGAIGAAADTEVSQLLTLRHYDPVIATGAAVAIATHLALEVDEVAAIYLWNDSPDRTASEVIEVLRAAAAIEQARHDAEQPANAAVTA